jgi:hypothetical protein
MYNRDMSRSRRWVEQSLRCGRACELVLHGWSMAPLMRDGDLITVEPLGAGGGAQPGEVVVASRAGLLVTHRLISLRDGVAVTRGDACGGDDPPVPANHLLGRVVRVRKRSRLSRWVGRLLG